MDVKDFFTQLKDKTVSLVKKTVSFCKENPRKAVIVLCSSLIVILLILLISIIAGRPKEEKEADGPQIVFTEELLVPDELVTEYSYDISRQTEEKWSEEETEKWFTIPTTEQINQLEKENESMISDVIGAAP